MNIDKNLLLRAKNSCELCKRTKNLFEFIVTPRKEKIIVCELCHTQLNTTLEQSHWHCLNDCMWSEVDAVKVVVFRVLTQLGNQDLLDMMYLEEDTKYWANEGLYAQNVDEQIRKDANGNKLQAGDSVILIKDLDVKGANFTAKRGTIVKNIKIGDVDNHIEGKINGTSIYLKCNFIKK